MGKAIQGLDHIVIFKNSQGEGCRGTLVHVTRTNIVFEVYNPFSIVQVSEVLSELKILRGETPVYHGRAVVGGIIPTGRLDIVSCTLLDPWSDLIAPSPGPELQEEVKNFVEEWEENNNVRPGYSRAVNNMKTFFRDLSQWLSQFEMIVGIQQLQQRPALQKEYCEVIERPLLPKMEELFIHFEEEGSQIEPEAVFIHKAYARRELHPFIMNSPFCHRTFTKPLGYAGDYEMVNMILRDPWEGSNTYAKIINAFLWRCGAAEAHRNRIKMLERHLKEEAERVAKKNRRLKILNIGCGPSVEIQRFIVNEPLSEYCDFELVDFNDETLRYAASRIEDAKRMAGRNISIKFQQRSIHEIVKMTSENNSLIQPTYDFVYCAGLFDYLKTPLCKRITKLFYNWVQPGGLVVVTNVHTSQPARALLEHLVEWHLILRNEEDMEQLAPAGTRFQIEKDKTGVNIFLSIRKEDETMNA